MTFIEILAIVLMLVFGVCSLFGLLLIVKKVCNYLFSKNKDFVESKVALNNYKLSNSWIFFQMNNSIEEQVSMILYYFKSSESSILYRELPFFLMQNSGANPCEIEKAIEIRHNFTEEQLYI